jgi:outer membrane lipoprotein-sorting protein
MFQSTFRSISGKTVAAAGFLALGLSLAGAADNPKTPGLSAAEIVDKNIAAKGGLQAWRAVQTMSMKGKLDAGGNNRSTLAMIGRRAGTALPPARPKEQAQLPFLVQLKRTRKARMELEFNGQTAIQVFDGTNGWKLRPFLNRREVEPYTPEEVKATALQSDLDGPLVDYVAKGTKIELSGVEKVGDSDAYKLTLTFKNGQTQRIWIDAKTFLDLKIDGTPRRLDGKYHPVATYMRDYRQVNGLMVPYTLETRVDDVNQVERIDIESVAVNPNIDDSAFAKLK